MLNPQRDKLELKIPNGISEKAKNGEKENRLQARIGSVECATNSDSISESKSKLQEGEWRFYCEKISSRVRETHFDSSRMQTKCTLNAAIIFGVEKINVKHQQCKTVTEATYGISNHSFHEAKLNFAHFLVRISIIHTNAKGTRRVSKVFGSIDYGQCRRRSN